MLPSMKRSSATYYEERVYIWNWRWLSKLKVFFCTGWNIAKDGIADYSRYIVKELKRLIDVDIIRLNHYVSEKDYYIQRAKEANQGDIVHIQFNYVYFNGPLPYRNRFLTFTKHLKVPIVMTAHEVRVGYDPIPPGVTSNIKRTIFNNTVLLWNFWSATHHRKMYGQVERIIAHTNGQADIIKGLVDDRERVMVIPHGIPIIPAKAKAISLSDAKTELGLDGKTVLTIFGFINRRKGYEQVMDAVLKLSGDVILLIAGGRMTDNVVDKEYYDSFLKMITDRGLKERVKITGYLKDIDVPRIMAATDICLAPFLSQSASGALSLCIGYNKPIIASNIQANMEINEKVPCLEIFRYGDSNELLMKINDLLDNRDRRMELSRLSGEYSKRFSYARIAEATVKVYEEVISSFRRM